MRRQVNFQEIGQRLRAVRKSLNIQQKEMAATLGMPASYLSEIESGKGNPGPDFFLKLASEYDFSLNYLFLGIGDMFLQGENKVKRQEFDIGTGIDSIEKMAWIMDMSPYFNTAVMAAANKLLYSDDDIIKKSMKKIV